MKHQLNHSVVLRWTLFLFTIGCLFFQMTAIVSASDKIEDLPPEVEPTLKYLLDLAKNDDATAFDARQIDPFVEFLLSPNPAGNIYSADASYGAPSAYHKYTINSDLQTIIDYILDADIPSFFFWPSSLRLSQWTRVVGGEQQLAKLRASFNDMNEPFALKGTEHITITPDQHTGAYFSYDVDRTVILSPYRNGKLMISIYFQQKPSVVGRKGWVLGKDDEWSYLYTQDKGLNVKGLGWANTYMYDSFGITVHYQPDPEIAAVTCGTVSWVKAGWAGINMVQSKHIHRGLVRVAQAFSEVMENPRLPEPARLAETFSKSRDLSTPTLKEFARDYLSGLEQRIASSEALSKKLGDAFNPHRLLEQMTRDELYAVLALDYFKKILGRNPVMDTHPF